MKPEIIQNGEFIEVIGHYDDEVQCAKMTLLAELYAVEYRDGYAKFPIEYADKLGLVDRKLEFAQVSIDLTTLSGWSGLSDGNHSITVKAKATGYRDSEASQAVSVTKSSSETWVFNDTPDVVTSLEPETHFNINFTCNRINYVKLGRGELAVAARFLAYWTDDSNWTDVCNMNSGWLDQNYRTVTFETAPTGDLLTWLQANAVKQ